ncbi:MAG: copper resistance protein CopC [Anaerolineaceae bacterium]|nr:copper resistance protein CopC [Anaerolineaceae bacterium]
MRLRQALLCALVLLLPALPAPAHGFIVRALPQDRAELEHAPARLRYWFSESLEPAFSTLTLRRQDGSIVAEGGVDPDNPLQMNLAVPAGLQDGVYLVDLRPAFASDGHVVPETRVFFLGHAADAAVGGDGGYAIEPLEALWRALLYGSCLLLFGAHVLYGAVLLPAWGLREQRAGGLPARLMGRLGQIALAALAVALVANLLAMLQQSMVFFATDAGAVLVDGLWQVVHIGSRFGDVWTARFLLLLLCASLVVLAMRWRRRHPEQVRPLWAANLWVVALLLGTFSINSHAAGSLRHPWLALLVDWLHTLAAAAWSGALVALALLLPVALRPLNAAQRGAATQAVLRRFTWMALRALAVLTASGLFSALNWLQRPSDLTDTDWGLALLAKMALVSLSLLAAAGQTKWFGGARWPVLSVHTGLRLEATLLTMTLVPLALLAAAAVPPPDLGAAPPAPSATQWVAESRVDISLAPGGPGINSLDLRIPGATQAQVQMVAPYRDWHSAWLEAVALDDGLFTLSTDVIDDEGHWQTLVDFQIGSGPWQRAAFAWEIEREATFETSLPTGVQHWLAILVLALAIFWSMMSPLRRALHWLNWQPASLAAAIGATLAFGLIVGLGVALVARNDAAWRDTLWPLPAIVNPELADAASLSRGRSLYDEHCAWEGAALEEIVTRLPRLRDEQLFTMTQEGWRSLPPCAGNISESGRWHLVNHIRSLQRGR